MKPYLLLSTIAIALFASCSTPTITISTAPPTKDVKVHVTGDLEISQEKISHRYIHRSGGGVNNAQNCAIVETLRLNGNADVLIAPQYEIKIKKYTIEVNVSGYPAKYKNLRSLSLDNRIYDSLKINEETQPIEISSMKEDKPVILDKDIAELEEDAKNGDEEAQFILGMMYMDNNNIDLAISWLKKAAIKGYMYAQYELGSLYLREGFPNAKKWLKKAADRGHEGAKELLKNL